MKIGDQYKVRVPTVWSKTLQGFQEGWKEWIKLLNGHTVELEYHDEMETDSQSIDGWNVITSIIPSSSLTSQWVPTEWLKPIETRFYCVSCGGTNKHRLMCPKTTT